MWNITEGITAAIAIEEFAIKHGYHVALGGSVLHKGKSKKDLDLFVYPHNNGSCTSSISSFLLHLGSELGIRVIENSSERSQYPESRTVVRAQIRNKRIDFIFLK